MDRSVERAVKIVTLEQAQTAHRVWMDDASVRLRAAEACQKEADFWAEVIKTMQQDGRE